jgi:hypothetical protein
MIRIRRDRIRGYGFPPGKSVVDNVFFGRFANHFTKLYDIPVLQ